MDQIHIEHARMLGGCAPLPYRSRPRRSGGNTHEVSCAWLHQLPCSHADAVDPWKLRLALRTPLRGSRSFRARKPRALALRARKPRASRFGPSGVAVFLGVRQYPVPVELIVKLGTSLVVSATALQGEVKVIPGCPLCALPNVNAVSSYVCLCFPLLLLFFLFLSLLPGSFWLGTCGGMWQLSFKETARFCTRFL